MTSAAEVLAAELPRVLLVDDEPTLLAGLRRVLQQDGIRALVANSGSHALSMLEEHGPNLTVVVSDFTMPGMDGAEFLRQVRLRWPDITRVLLSGNADFAAAARVVNDGWVWRVCSKPCAPDYFRQTVAQAHEHHQVKLENRLLRTLADERAAALADWNERLEQEVLERTAELEQANARLQDSVDTLAKHEAELWRLSMQLLEVQEEERKRLSLDLHDDPLQRAVLLIRAIKGSPPSADTLRWQNEVEEIVFALKAICQSLRPRALDDFGLADGLEWLISNVMARSEMATTLTIRALGSEPFGRLNPELEVALYRVTQEALNDVLNAGSATACDVDVVRDGSSLALSVSHDGRLVDPPVPGVSLNLLRMRERLAPWHGSVRLEATADGGTLIHADVRGVNDQQTQV